jgi:hypothetical protein
MTKEDFNFFKYTRFRNKIKSIICKKLSNYNKCISSSYIYILLYSYMYIII